ncbi:hypothetical protein BROUX41_001140 [Berkeleyomyces rouxiae]
MSNPPALASVFVDLDFASHAKRWDALWAEQKTPWDCAQPSPALSEALAKVHCARARLRRALVPGCGRGYDVRLLASWGFDAVGLDASTTAIVAAEQATADAEASGIYDTPDGAYALKPGVARRGDVRWVAADFFADDLVQRLGGPFDLVYDYTFLCALPVAVRPRWAAQMARLLAPAGRLVCLEFPLAKLPAAGGPPHALRASAYVALLGRPGAAVEYDESGEAAGVPGEAGACEPGLLRVLRFKPSATNRMGYAEDGSVVDFISVWKH